MKQGNRVSMGPGAASLILIAVMLSMSVLGMLSLMTARNDRKLSERSAAVAGEIYLLNAQAEETRAKAEELLAELYEGDTGKETAGTGLRQDSNPEADQALIDQELTALHPDLQVKDNVISWTEQGDSYILNCALSWQTSAGTGGYRTAWIRHQLEVTAGGWEDEEWNF